MTGITLFQCVPCYKPAATARLIKPLLDMDCKILLDIEDSIQDVQNPNLTSKLKHNARRDCEEILNYFPNQKFSLRINSAGSDEFQHDIHYQE